MRTGSSTLANGNLTGKTEDGVTVSYTYLGNGQARPHAVTSLTNGNSYSYDANGEMTSRTEKGVSYT